ncbi:MAG: CrcB family protein [Vampirovibrionales bacterium]|nr:CrcB family protein [Vampirovibrionales bacterium]
MYSWLLVMVGGALGAVSRWAFSGWLAALLGGLWWGTLVVNLLGCLGLGMAWASVDRWGTTNPAFGWVTPLVMAGFFGGFTTLSGLHKDVWQLIQGQAWGSLAWYSGLSWLGGLLCLILGRALIVGIKV